LAFTFELLICFFIRFICYTLFFPPVFSITLQLLRDKRMCLFGLSNSYYINHSNMHLLKCFLSRWHTSIPIQMPLASPFHLLKYMDELLYVIFSHRLHRKWYNEYVK